MLYLMRKLGQSIVINGDIEVKVVEVKGRSVKLGFEFPPTATVLRKEVHDRIVAENLAAAQTGMEADISDAMSGIDLKLGNKDGAEDTKKKSPKSSPKTDE